MQVKNYLMFTYVCKHQLSNLPTDSQQDSLEKSTIWFIAEHGRKPAEMKASPQHDGATKLWHNTTATPCFTAAFSPCFPPLMAFGTRVKRSSGVSVRAHPSACFLCHLHVASYCLQHSLSALLWRSDLWCIANGCHGDGFSPLQSCGSLQLFQSQHGPPGCFSG